MSTSVHIDNLVTARKAWLGNVRRRKWSKRGSFPAPLPFYPRMPEVIPSVLYLSTYLWKLSTIFSCPRRSFFVRWSNILASTRHSINVVRYWGRPSAGSHALPIHSWFISPNASVVLDVLGADGDVNDTISWMASRNLSRCRGLLIPISLWISVSLRALMMAPDFTFARQAATYHAGMPTHNSNQATIVGPFHNANGVPAFIASANSSCL